MSIRKLSSADQLALRNSARKELERLEQLMADMETLQLLDKFKTKFNMCETVYMIILKKHQECKGKESKSDLKVDMRQVPHALYFAGYSFDKKLLNDLFGVSSNSGRTVKKLCEVLSCGIDQKTVNEIVARKVELFGYMDSFLSEIRTCDAVVA